MQLYLLNKRRKRKKNKTIPLQGEVTTLFVNTFEIVIPNSSNVTFFIIGNKTVTQTN